MRNSKPKILSLLSAGLLVALVGSASSPTPQRAAAGVADLPASALATADVKFAAMWPQPMICPPPPSVYGGNVSSSASGALDNECVFDTASFAAMYWQDDWVAPPPYILAYGNITHDPANPGAVRDQVFD